jgi:hypothetical protein
MKVSSISGNSLETDFIADRQGITFFQAAQSHAASLLKIADRIGTSIALGEKADLDAAHEYRNQKPGKNE